MALKCGPPSSVLRCMELLQRLQELIAEMCNIISESITVLAQRIEAVGVEKLEALQDGADRCVCVCVCVCDSFLCPWKEFVHQSELVSWLLL